MAKEGFTFSTSGAIEDSRIPNGRREAEGGNLSEELNLSTRWTSREGRERTQSILGLLRTGKSTAIAALLGTHEGRSDLRGFLFPKPRQTGQSIGFSGYEVSMTSEPQRFERLILEDIDFSCADMTETIWKRCNFSNCEFDNSRLNEAAFFDCHVSESRFVNSNLTGCVLGGHVRNHSGELVNCRFQGGKFKEVVFAFPKLEGCRFDCDVVNVDFNGSQLTDCIFTGRLDKVIFRRKPSKSVTDEIRLARLIPENRMEHVDFSEADLHDVDFRNGIDLTKCIFSKGRRGMFLVLDGTRVFAEVRRQIESSWNGENRRIGLGYTANYFMDRIKDGQRHFLIDEDSIIEDWGEPLGHCYVTMIRAVAQRLGVLDELGRVPHDPSSDRR
jgi:uncharacterized protein YjbI with pentapeptide repeats